MDTILIIFKKGEMRMLEYLASSELQTMEEIRLFGYKVVFSSCLTKTVWNTKTYQFEQVPLDKYIIKDGLLHIHPETYKEIKSKLPPINLGGDEVKEADNHILNILEQREESKIACSF